MSSDVHAKWMNSATAAISGNAGEALLQPVLDRLDVVVGRALDRLHPRASAGGNDAAGVGERGARGARRTARPRRCPGSSASAKSQAISTRTRARIRPNSLKCSRSGGDLRGVTAVERRQRGQRGERGGFGIES